MRMLIALTLVAASAAQAQDYRWSGPLAAGKELRVRNIIGDIRVEGSRSGTVEITAVKRRGEHGDPADVTIRRVETAQGVEFCVVYPRTRAADDDDCDWNDRGRHENRREERNDTRVNFTIQLPEGARLDAATVAGDVWATGLRGEVEVASVSGELVLRDVTADVVDAHTVSGDVELRDVRAEAVDGQTVSGDIEFTGPVRDGGRYDLQTLSGDVTLILPSGSGAEVTASSFSGDIASDFPLTMQVRSESRWMKRRRVEGVIGEGGAQLRLESFSGDVRIRRSGQSG